MSIERVFHCDGPECDRHVRTISTQPPTFLTVVETEADQSLHFCGWDCVLRYAGAMPPEEVIPAEAA